MPLNPGLSTRVSLTKGPVLDEDELTLRALASPPANSLPEGDANACLNRWWTWARSMQDR